MKKSLLILTILLSLTSFSFDKRQILSSKNYDEVFYSTQTYYSISNFVHGFDYTNTYWEGNVPITFRLINMEYYVGINYIDKNNNERNFIEESIRNKISSSNKIYTLDFKIPLNELNNLTTINIYIESPLLNHKFSINYKVTNPKSRIYLNDSEKIYYNYEFFNNIGKNYFYEVIPTSFKECEKNYFYYDYFSFKDFYIESNYNRVPNPYLYIYDPSTLFLGAFSLLGGESVNTKFIKLNLNKEDNRFYLTFSNDVFLNRANNLMYSYNNGSYIEIDDRIYMPKNYYDQYKKITLGIVFRNFSSFYYNLYYEFIVTFENNFPIDSSVIYKEEGYVYIDEALIEINL